MGTGDEQRVVHHHFSSPLFITIIHHPLPSPFFSLRALAVELLFAE
jgi:hypothetical protein